MQFQSHSIYTQKESFSGTDFSTEQVFPVSHTSSFKTVMLMSISLCECLQYATDAKTCIKRSENFDNQFFPLTMYVYLGSNSSHQTWFLAPFTHLPNSIYPF